MNKTELKELIKELEGKSMKYILYRHRKGLNVTTRDDSHRTWKYKEHITVYSEVWHSDRYKDDTSFNMALYDYTGDKCLASYSSLVSNKRPLSSYKEG